MSRTITISDEQVDSLQRLILHVDGSAGSWRPADLRAVLALLDVAPPAVDLGAVAWSKTAPTVAGFYWRRHNADDRAVVVEVDGDGDAYFAGVEPPSDVTYLDGEWCPCVPPLAARKVET